MAASKGSSRRAHWERVFRGTASDRLSWYQAEPALSLTLIRRAAGDTGARVLDVGGGTSRLVDRLLEDGFRHIGLLDISEAAVGQARARLGPAASKIEWFTTDVLRFRSPHEWDIWHDRAVFHFLTEPVDRRRYRRALLRSLAHGGHAILATFGPTGPEMCSGLPAVRYDPGSLGAELGPELTLIDAVPERHITPGGKAQDFLYVLFRRAGSS